MSAPAWEGGAPSFSLSLSRAEILALLRRSTEAALKSEENGTQRLKLALALQWLETTKMEGNTMSTFDTEDGRLQAAEAAGRNVALFEIRNGHTTPRDWSRDGNPNAGAYSHLAAVGFTRLGCRAYSGPFIRAYLQVFETGA